MLGISQQQQVSHNKTVHHGTLPILIQTGQEKENPIIMGEGYKQQRGNIDSSSHLTTELENQMLMTEYRTLLIEQVNVLVQNQKQ